LTKLNKSINIGQKIFEKNERIYACKLLCKYFHHHISIHRKPVIYL